jgi:hypothetical protein
MNEIQEKNPILRRLFDEIQTMITNCPNGHKFAQLIAPGIINDHEPPPMDRKLEGLLYGALNAAGHHLPAETPEYVHWSKRLEAWTTARGVQVGEGEHGTIKLAYFHPWQVCSLPKIEARLKDGYVMHATQSSKWVTTQKYLGSADTDTPGLIQCIDVALHPLSDQPSNFERTAGFCDETRQVFVHGQI